MGGSWECTHGRAPVESWSSSERGFGGARTELCRNFEGIRKESWRILNGFWRTFWRSSDAPLGKPRDSPQDTLMKPWPSPETILKSIFNNRSHRYTLWRGVGWLALARGHPSNAFQNSLKLSLRNSLWIWLLLGLAWTMWQFVKTRYKSSSRRDPYLVAGLTISNAS